MRANDPSFDYLLHLNGQTFFLDERGRYWVKFVVHRVPKTKARPHGVSYSLTLHGASGERLLGFDNAHPVKGSGDAHADHRHLGPRIQPYAYRDAASLIEDFWSAVDRVLKEGGVV